MKIGLSAFFAPGPKGGDDEEAVKSQAPKVDWTTPALWNANMCLGVTSFPVSCSEIVQFHNIDNGGWSHYLSGLASGNVHRLFGEPELGGH